MRYFFVTTVGINPNGSQAFNSFDIKRNSEYPTLREVISSSVKLHPEQRNVAIIAITEMSEVDFYKFSSEQ